MANTTASCEKLGIKKPAEDKAGFRLSEALTDKDALYADNGRYLPSVVI